jgi:hypothetical protein
MVDSVDAAPPDQATEAGRLAQESAEAFMAAELTTDPEDKAEALDKAQTLAAESELAAAYTHLQQIIGVIALLLPFVVAIGNMFFNGIELRGSISAYYYTPMGGVFVGALCALAVFFLSYNYRPLPKFRLDNVLSTLASAVTVGVALLPTTSDAATASGSEKLVAFLHLVCACALFVLLAIFSLFLFTQTGDGAMTPEKARRNQVYRACGAIIVASIVLVVVTNIVDPPRSWHTLFWLESVGVVAFGVSWLVKGYAPPLWADRRRT